MLNSLVSLAYVLIGMDLAIMMERNSPNLSHIACSDDCISFGYGSF